MPKGVPKNPRPGFVVLHEVAPGTWEVLGEVERRPGLPGRAARTAAIREATGGDARGEERYAALLRSEWNLSQNWDAESPEGTERLPARRPRRS